MTKLELMSELQETLQRDNELTLDMKLSDLDEWDSLAYISVISLYDELFEIVVTTVEIEKCITVEELIDLILTKKDN